MPPSPDATSTLGDQEKFAADLPAALATRVTIGKVQEYDPHWINLLSTLDTELRALLPDYRVEVEAPRGYLSIYVDVDDYPPCCDAGTDHSTSQEHDDHVATYHAAVARAERLTERMAIRARIKHYQPRPALGDTSPVVALDIDGVLNVLAARPELVRHDVVIPAGLVTTPFMRGGGRSDLAVTLHVDPVVIAWVNDLVARGVCVVWASSWEEAARVVFAPAVGVVDFPVGITTTTLAPKLSQDLADWKADALYDAFPSRPLIWVDDMAWRFEERLWRHPDDDEATLVLVPDPVRGITQEHITSIEQFLARYTPPLP
jgi:hypothetical protein